MLDQTPTTSASHWHDNEYQLDPHRLHVREGPRQQGVRAFEIRSFFSREPIPYSSLSAYVCPVQSQKQMLQHSQLKTVFLCILETQ